MRKQQIHKDFEKAFGQRLFSKSIDYIISEQDLYVATEIFNKHIFNNKLNLDEIEIISVPYDKQKDKANTAFGHYKKPTAKYLIKIMQYKPADNFYQIMKVLSHELIHVYDYKYGEIFKILTKHCDEILSGFYVTNQNNNQYVGNENYNAHGKYFMQFANKLNSCGFDVHQEFNVNGARKMKKLKEKDIEKQEKYDFFYETDESKDALTYKAIKRVFDSIIAPGKRLVYRNAKEWFIEFP